MKSVRLYKAAEVREIDRIAIEEQGIAGLTLMKRAAEACVSSLLAAWPDSERFLVLCGSGNNAGDGFIIAGLLAAKSKSVQVGLVGKVPATNCDAGEAYQFCLDGGVDIRTDNIAEMIPEAEILVDAMLGTGLSGEVREEYRSLIQTVNQSGLPVLSVDLPSGLCADTGSVLGACVKADITVTFIGRKLGLYTNDGPEYSGDVQFASLGVPDVVFEGVTEAARSLFFEELIRRLPARHKNAHKVSHGHLLIVGGDEGMGGAVSMSAEAALYSGAGMVSVATRSSNVAAIVSRRPEVMARGVESAEELEPLLARANAIVLGPGLGQGAWGKAMFAALRDSALPMLLDADGLNLLSQDPLQDGRDNRVYTPHPGEAARLLPDTNIQGDRIAAVTSLQKKLGGVVLLKGAGTLIADSESVSLCPYGNPGMAVAGMGDVLSGVIGSLIAQGLSNTEATQLGAVLHSLAADQIVRDQGNRGLLATELLPVIRSLINQTD